MAQFIYIIPLSLNDNGEKINVTKKRNHISFKILDTSIPRLTYSTLSDDPYDMYIKLFFHFAV